jgi:acetate---CoA ligase (ADP-forming)
MKGQAPDVAHRSDAGLVSGKVSNDAELHREYLAIQEKARVLTGERVLVSVEKYLPHDFEIILGVKYDATFGPVILCGWGGIFAEVLKDYALRLAPLTAIDARDMLSSLKAFPVLQKATANGSTHVDSLTDALLRLSILAIELRGQISSVDINPIALNSASSQLNVLDAKIHI